MAAFTMQQAAPLIVRERVPRQPPPSDTCTIKCFAVGQLVNGIFATVCFMLTIRWLYPIINIRIALFISIAGWIALTGIIGVCSAWHYNGACLNCIYMIFSLISACGSLAGLFFAVTLFIGFYYQDSDSETCYNEECKGFYSKNIGLGLHIGMIVFMVIEFFMSTIATVFCCKNSKCCGRHHSQGGMVIHQQPYIRASHVGTCGGYPTDVVRYPGQVGGLNGGQTLPHANAPLYYNAEAPPAYEDIEMDGKKLPAEASCPPAQEEGSSKPDVDD